MQPRSVVAADDVRDFTPPLVHLRERAGVRNNPNIRNSVKYADRDTMTLLSKLAPQSRQSKEFTRGTIPK